MKFFADFLRQKVPAPGRIMPAYYRRALVACGAVLACYFLGVCILSSVITGSIIWMPSLFSGLSLLFVVTLRRRNILWNFLAFTALLVLWCLWGIYRFGWSYGLQHFLIVLLLFLFFNVCVPPGWKIALSVVLLGYRVALFALSRVWTPITELDATTGIAFQTANSATFFLLVALVCILFSSSVQDTERQLRLDNENLNREAGTDPLTGLPNRREMISMIERFRKESPDAPFSVAIADIDFFKKVNDTYGHACGDMTLVSLTNLFRSESQGRYLACRWGGEEFCFFMPNVNIDEAGILMKDLNFAVEKMPLEYEGKTFSITITIGVEETDFHSPLADLLNSADEKLYLGKESGRNKVVV